MQRPGEVSMCVHENKPFHAGLCPAIGVLTYKTHCSLSSYFIHFQRQCGHNNWLYCKISSTKFLCGEWPHSPSASALSSAQVVVKEISISQEAAIES